MMVASYWFNLWNALRGRPVEVRFVGMCTHGVMMGESPNLRRRQFWTADDVAMWRARFAEASERMAEDEPVVAA